MDRYHDWMTAIDRGPQSEEIAEVIRLVCGGADHQRTMADLFRRIPLPVRGPVLEVGCATGETTRLFARMTGGRWPIVGVDPSRTVLAQAVALTRAASPPLAATYCQADGAALPFGEGRFALVFTARVLQHAVDPSAVLAEMVRVLAPGGTLLCVEQDLGACFEAGVPDDLFRRAFADTNPELARELPAWMRRAGLEVIDVVPCVWVLREPRVGVEGLRQEFRQRRGTVWPRVAAGVLTEAEAEAYFDAVARSAAEGRYLRVIVNLATIARKPGE